MYKLADGTMSTDYKVGDRFLVVEDSAYFNKGDVITLSGDDMTGCPFFNEGEPCHWYKMRAYKSFTKSDLKDGMVVTYRNKMERVVLGDKVYYDEAGSYKKAGSLWDFTDELKRKGNANLDIVKVGYMGKVLWERIKETPEQKEIKRLQGIIKEAQDALNVINTGNK